MPAGGSYRRSGPSLSAVSVEPIAKVSERSQRARESGSGFRFMTLTAIAIMIAFVSFQASASPTVVETVQSVIASADKVLDRTPPPGQAKKLAAPTATVAPTAAPTATAKGGSRTPAPSAATTT